MTHFNCSNFSKTGIQGFFLSLFLGVAQVQSAELIRSYDEASGQVTLMATPDPGTVIYALEEPLPEGVNARAISHEGKLDPFASKLKWGPFFDDQARAFSYQLVTSEERDITFSGVASWDGSEAHMAEGAASGAVPVDAYFTWLLDALGSEALANGEPDPTSDADQDRFSLLGEYVFGMTPGVLDQPPMFSVEWNATAEQIELRFQRRLNLGPVQVSFWESDRLRDWTEFDPGETQMLEELSSDLGLYRIMRDFTGSRKFIQMRFSLPDGEGVE